MTLEKDVKDIQDEAKFSKEAARNRIDALEAMLRSEGWKYFVESLDENILRRKEEALAPTENALMLPLKEYVKGAAYGLAMARDMPEVLIEADRTQLHEAMEVEELAERVAQQEKTEDQGDEE